MGRVLAGLVGLVLVLAIGFAGWYFQPWAAYSPAKIAQLNKPEEYITTFQKMDAVLPASVVAATAPSPLPMGEASLPETFEFNGETIVLADYFDRAKVTGFSVLHDGALVSESYFHGADETTQHTSWSVAKSLVATLVAKAMHDGLIDSMDDPAEKYAPQYEGSDFGQTSIRHLLMMSAGMDFNEEYSESGDSDIMPLFFNAFIWRKNVDTLITEFERNREPGEDQHYTSPNSHVLAAVARGVYGGRLVDIVEEHIWTPLGMSSNASWLQNKPGEGGMAIGYCCFQATSRDYARMGEFYRQDGIWNEERLLPEGWVLQATTPNEDFQEPGNTPYPGRGYGLHFWIPEGYDREYFMAGVYGQYVWVDEHRGIVIAQNAGDPVWGANREEAMAVFRAVGEHISPLIEAAEPATLEEAEDDSEVTADNE
jgi:CubicO group peptidase (beta-lactamase class C family)